MKMEIGQRFIPYQKFNGNFFPILNFLMERETITHSEKEILRILNKFAFEDGKCYPSHKRLEEEIGLCNGQVRNLLRSLEQKGLLEIHRPNPLRRHVFRRHNEYFFLWHSAYSEYAEKTAKIKTDTETDSEIDTETDTGCIYKSLLRKSKKTATGRIAVAVPLADETDTRHAVNDRQPIPSVDPSTPADRKDDSDINEFLSVIPADIPVTKGITRVIKAHLAKSGPELVMRNIAYVNAVKLRNRTSYRAYLDKALREDYAIDLAENRKHAEQAQQKVMEKAIRETEQARQELTDGLNADRKREELAQRFLTMPEDVRENVRQSYLAQCKAFILKKAKFLDHAGLAASLGFRLYLESSVSA